MAAAFVAMEARAVQDKTERMRLEILPLNVTVQAAAVAATIKETLAVLEDTMAAETVDRAADGTETVQLLQLVLRIPAAVEAAKVNTLVLAIR